MLSLVIPVFRNAENLPRLLTELERLSLSVTDGLEVVFVVDGSPDASLQILQERLPSWLVRAKLIELARNFGSFAAIAILLAAIGLYGAMAHSVGRRTRELGIRMAVGADKGIIFRMVMREGLAVAPVGLVFGLGASVTGHPVTFAVNGKQYVAVSTGRSNVTGGLTRLAPEAAPAESDNKLFVFALPD